MAKSVSVFIVRNAPGELVPFTPDPVYVNVGDLVIWSNRDTQIHTATSGDPVTEVPDRKFDSGMLRPENTYNFEFEQVGEYDYYCTIHPQMTGKVIVRPILHSQPPLE
jgi:plastocyanin